jgi:hypothetical protein
MTEKEEMARTESSPAHRRLYKSVTCRKLAKCPYCPWHGGENAGRVPRRSWKRYRREQYSARKG